MKAQIPLPKDWKSALEKEISNKNYNEADILQILYRCQEYIGEIQPINQWMSSQQAYITQMYNLFSQMYSNMFGKQPPPRPPVVPITEVLNTTELRKNVIREVALAITKPGDEVTDESILQELSHRGKKIVASNPTAAISTILNGFKSQFIKVEGKRGVFKRQVAAS